ncbi:MAG: YezD family protein [Planctomycetia bacterium]|jgi:hypothetical protein
MSNPVHDPSSASDRGDGVPSSGRPDAAIRRIGEALHGLKYGSVLVIVQDGVVVQIERTEKIRFGK